MSLKLPKIISHFPILLSMISPLAAAMSVESDLDFDIQTMPLKAEYVTTQENKESIAAKFNSGLALSVNHRILDLSLDYRLQGDLNGVAQTEDGDFSQVINGVLRSLEFNEFFNVDAVFKADSLVKSEGDIYRHFFTSELRRPVYNLAHLNVKYSYGLNKASPLELEQEVMNYSLGLAGDLANGRLAWQSRYGKSSTEKEEALHQNITEQFDLNSRYLILSDLQLDLSGSLKKQSYPGGARDIDYDEKRYGAGLYWSPNQEYSLSIKVNRLGDSRFDSSDLYGSGAITWTPHSLWQIELSYDNHLLDGARGLLLRAKVNLDES